MDQWSEMWSFGPYTTSSTAQGLRSFLLLFTMCDSCVLFTLINHTHIHLTFWSTSSNRVFGAKQSLTSMGIPWKFQSSSCLILSNEGSIVPIPCGLRVSSVFGRRVSPEKCLSWMLVYSDAAPYHCLLLHLRREILNDLKFLRSAVSIAHLLKMRDLCKISCTWCKLCKVLSFDCF